MRSGLRVLYSDLDGTLLGPGGSLFTTPTGTSLRAAEALLALERAGVGLVLVSGRTRAQMSELARAFSAEAYVAEMGALVVERRDGSEVVTREFGSWRGDGTPYEAMARSGAGAFVLDSYVGRVEPHTPWSSHHREATMLFRGQLDLAEANAALQDAGYGWLELSDNGIIRRGFPGLEVEEVHAYHLIPRGVGKGAGVRRHMQVAGIAPEQAAGVGDSRSDLEIAPEVRTMFIVANGRAAVGSAADAFPNVRFTESSHGVGFAEAVAELLGGPLP